MKGDFSRRIFDAGQHYDAVLHQQGRVWLDSDWNDDVLARLLALYRETADIIGPIGFSSSAFQITPTAASTAAAPDFAIAPGRAYLQGVACGLDAATTYLTQPNLPGAPALSLPTDGSPANLLVYLEVWQRFISYLQDSSIREVALGGPDTTGRIQTVAQVRTVALPSTFTDLSCLNASSLLPTPADGTLTVVQAPVSTTTSLCTLPESGTYTGLENLLYRVEVHQPGTIQNPASSPPDTTSPSTNATFKWSRNNASFAVAVTAISADRLTLTISSLGRDQSTALHMGDTVEIIDDSAELSTSAGLLTNLTSDPDPDLLTVTLAVALPPTFQIASNLILRRWDGTGTAVTSFDSVATPQMDLGNGIHIQFGGTTLNSGDYWQFSARTDGTVEALNAAPPQGIRRLYAPLAVVNWSAAPLTSPPSSPPSSPPAFDYVMTVLSDCRIVFPTLAQPGVHITSIALPGAVGGPIPLANDNSVALLNLLGGISIICDANVAPASLSRAVCNVTVELPVPLGNPIYTQQQTPDLAGYGYTSVVLQGTATVAGNVITWTPAYPDALALMPFNLVPGSDRGILAKLMLNGNCVWSAANPSVYLDGESYGYSQRTILFNDPNSTLLEVKPLTTSPLRANAIHSEALVSPVLNSTLLNPVLGTPIVASPILANPIRANPVLTNPILGNPISIGPILANPILGNPISVVPITPVASPPVLINPIHPLPPIFRAPLTRLHLPSGDGRAGGTFETWFWISPPPAVSFTLTNPTGQTVRSEGVSELLHELSITVAGGVPVTAGAVVPTYNITVALSRVITTPSAGGYNDVVLIIDDPAALNTADLTSPPPLYGTDGEGESYSDGTAPNIFRGIPSGSNSVVFNGIPIDAPAPGATRVLRIANLRVDMTQGNSILPTGAVQFLQFVTATVTGLSAAPMGPVTVAIAQRGLAAINARPTLTAGSPPSAPPVSVLLPTIEANGSVPQNAPVTAFLEFDEGFAGAFTSVATESGYSNAAVPGLGQATQGTRLRAILTGIPSGVGVFATMTELRQSALLFNPGRLIPLEREAASAETLQPHASLIAPVETAPIMLNPILTNPVIGTPIITQPILNFWTPRASLVLTDATGAGSGTPTAVGSTNTGVQLAAVSVVNGTATVVWEWTDDTASTSPTNAVFGFVLTGTPNTLTGSIAIQGDLAPVVAASTAPVNFNPVLLDRAASAETEATATHTVGAHATLINPVLGTHPVVTAPIVTAPVITTPVLTNPILTSPVITAPIVTTPVLTNPIPTNPVITVPVINDPITNPILTGPVLTNPVITTPVITNPIITTPIITTPIITNPVITNPVITNPVIGIPILSPPIILPPIFFPPPIPRFHADALIINPAITITFPVNG